MVEVNPLVWKVPGYNEIFPYDKAVTKVMVEEKSIVEYSDGRVSDAIKAI